MIVSVTYTPAEFESRDVSDAWVVVIDCFRASTSIVAALSQGANAIYTFLGVEEAREEASRRKRSVLAGERGGARIEGFDLGNSPEDFTAAAVGGRDVIMTTTNGTRLLTAAANAGAVFVAGYVNLSATIAATGGWNGRLVLATAGTEGYLSIEDALCAGLFVERLAAGGADLDDSARFARLAYRNAEGSLREEAVSGRGASNVRTLGLDRDLDFCLAVDTIPLVARAVLDPLRVLRA